MADFIMFMANIVASWRREWRHLRKDRTTISLLFLVPAMQLLLFGFAIRPETARIPIAIAGADSDRAEQLSQTITLTNRFTIIANQLPAGGAEKLLRRGDVLIAIEMPKLADLDDEAPQQPVRVLADMSNPAATGPALQALEAAYWKRVAEVATLGRSTGLKVNIERLYNPQSRSAWAFAPALIGVSIMVSMLLFGALSTHRSRSIADVTGKLLLYGGLAVLQALLVLLLSRVLFALPVAGNILALLVLVPLFAAAHVLLGFIIAARSAQAMQAVQSAVAFYFPAMILSGFLYPFESMPRWAQLIGEALPLTHFIRAARDALLRGSDAATILSHSWPMIIFVAAVSGMYALMKPKPVIPQ
jgi:ABC-2 type transport system permease protein